MVDRLINHERYYQATCIIMPHHKLMLFPKIMGAGASRTKGHIIPSRLRSPLVKIVFHLKIPKKGFVLVKISSEIFEERFAPRILEMAHVEKDR